MTGDGKSREALLREADEARTRLLRTVVVLDQRRHHALDLPKQMGHYLRRFAIVGAIVAVGAVGTGAVTALAVHRVMTRARRRSRHQGGLRRLARSVVRLPDRETRATRETRPKRRSFMVEVVRSLMLTLVTTALRVPLRRAIRGAVGR